MRAALHIDPPLAAIPAALAAAGVSAFQTTLRDPQRFGRTGVPGPEDCAAYKAAVAAGRPLWGIVHGSLLVNLASPDGRIRNASASSVVGDLGLAADLGLAGVCFHPGYAKGYATRAAALAQAARKLVQVLAQAPDDVTAVIENTCEGSELAADVAELAALVRDVGAPAARLGVLIDTCHLHAAGFDLSGEDAGDRLAGALADAGLLDRLVAFHLNDCQGPAGCRRDRHEVPGDGSINAGLVSIGRHPAFRGLPAILELAADGARRGIVYLARHGVLVGD
ncbi:MAG TPA: TIM barrel protein [Candidatus Binatia bacterium]|nr:TIM barrel protein [Candidatus Binatia bacterium]